MNEKQTRQKRRLTTAGRHHDGDGEVMRGAWESGLYLHLPRLHLSHTTPRLLLVNLLRQVENSTSSDSSWTLKAPYG